MGRTPDMPAEPWLPAWLGLPSFDEGVEFEIGGQPFVVRDGIPRSRALVTGAQEQTREAFGFKWQQVKTFDSTASLARVRQWLVERYGDVETASWWADHGARPIVLDAGCGAGMSALEMLGGRLGAVRYLGVDLSEAVDVAQRRFRARRVEGAFLQADVSRLRLPEHAVDVIVSEGVLHHTDSTERALAWLARLLKPGGRLLFYVYRRKGPVREFTDDYVRSKVQAMTPAEAWRAMEPLTKLGIALGELNAEIDIPEPIELLEIPAGPISVQRLFYWHVAKVFYRPDLTVDEMNHINFDWYAPANAHRQSPDDVRRWCAAGGLAIEREVIEDAGITVIARKF